MDIFIKTYHKDFIFLEYLLLSIKKFAVGFRDVVIVCDNVFIPEHILDILPVKVFYEVLPNVDFEIEHGIGYLFQQYVKLNWVKYTDAEAVLVLDSDWMLTKPFKASDLIIDSKYYYCVRDWSDAENAICWKESTDKILKVDTKKETMCCAGYVLTRKTTLELHKFFGMDIWDYIVKNRIHKMSEFNIYGNFILNYFPEEYKIVKYSEDLINSSIRVSWSWGGLSEDERIKRLAILDV